MTDELDWSPILAAIEQGIKSARQQRLEALPLFLLNRRPLNRVAAQAR